MPSMPPMTIKTTNRESRDLATIVWTSAATIWETMDLVLGSAVDPQRAAGVRDDDLVGDSRRRLVRRHRDVAQVDPPAVGRCDAHLVADLTPRRHVDVIVARIDP